MSDTLKSAGYAMPTTTGVLHTSPVTITSIVLSGAVHNPTAGIVQVTLTIAKDTGGTVTIADAVDIAVGGFFNIPDKLVLESEDTLDGFCSVAGCSIGLNYAAHSDDIANTTLAQQAAMDADASRDLSETAATNAEASAVAAASANIRELKETNLGAVAVDTALDCSLWNYFILEPTADLTLTFTNVTPGAACLVELLGAGDHSITWAGVTFVWDTDDLAAPLTAVDPGSSILAFISKDGSTFSGKLAYKLV
jgi:hypothetical protein